MIIENVCFRKYVVENEFLSLIPLLRAKNVVQDIIVTS